MEAAEIRKTLDQGKHAVRTFIAAINCKHYHPDLLMQLGMNQQLVDPPIPDLINPSEVPGRRKLVISTFGPVALPRLSALCESQELRDALLANMDFNLREQVRHIEVLPTFCQTCPFWSAEGRDGDR